MGYSSERVTFHQIIYFFQQPWDEKLQQAEEIIGSDIHYTFSVFPDNAFNINKAAGKKMVKNQSGL